MTQPERGDDGDRGATAAASMVVIALSMVLFVVCANLLIAGWGRGVVRGALDEGARMGARAGAGPAVCEQHVGEAIGQLLGGSLADGISYRCTASDTAVTATAEVTFPGWLPGVPDLTYHTAAQSIREPEVGP